MDLEEQLVAQLKGPAERVARAEVDVLGIAREASRRRTRRRMLVAVVATAAAAVVIAGSTYAVSRHPDAAPNPAAPPTTSLTADPTEVPWLADGVLHLGRTEIRTELRRVLFRGGSTLVGGETGGRPVWDVVLGERLTRLPTGTLARDPVLSADGSRAMWITVVDDTTRRVTLWDLAANSEVGEVTVPVRVECCDQSGELDPVGIDLSGRGYWTTRRTTTVWTPGDDQRPVDVDETLTSYGPDPWPGGAMIEGTAPGPLAIGPGRYGTVDADGHFRPQGEVAVGVDGLWSDDGEQYAFVGTADGVGGFQPEKFSTGSVSLWMQTRDAEPVEADLVAPRVVAWEPGGTLIVAAENDDLGTSLWRCDAEAQCAEIEPLPAAATLPGDP